MARKFGFYDRCGTEEYYVYDPDDDGDLSVWLRETTDAQTGETHLRPAIFDRELVSPRMKTRFVPRPNADMKI